MASEFIALSLLVGICLDFDIYYSGYIQTNCQKNKKIKRTDQILPEVYGTTLMVLGSTRTVLEPTIYYTRGERANHYATDAVIYNGNMCIYIYNCIVNAMTYFGIIAWFCVLCCK